MEQYTEVTTIKLSKIQKQTLGKLRERKIRVSQFIRDAIAEKIKREYKYLMPKVIPEKCPF